MPDPLYSDSLSDANPFEPLLRLRQLAREIQAAIARNDLEVVYQAANLLPSVLARWNAIYPTLPLGAGDAAQIAMDTRNLLDGCEASLMQAMQKVREELRNHHRAKKLIAQNRSRRAVNASGKTLDTTR